MTAALALVPDPVIVLKVQLDDGRPEPHPDCPRCRQPNADRYGPTGNPLCVICRRKP